MKKGSFKSSEVSPRWGVFLSDLHPAPGWAAGSAALVELWTGQLAAHVRYLPTYLGRYLGRYSRLHCLFTLELGSRNRAQPGRRITHTHAPLTTRTVLQRLRCSYDFLGWYLLMRTNGLQAGFDNDLVSQGGHGVNPCTCISGCNEWNGGSSCGAVFVE